MKMRYAVAMMTLQPSAISELRFTLQAKIKFSLFKVTGPVLGTLLVLGCGGSPSNHKPVSKKVFIENSTDYRSALINAGAPVEATDLTLQYFNDRYSSFSNRSYIAIIDFSLHSMEERMWVLDLNTSEVKSYLTAHGKGSDPDHNGYAEKFSNISGSKMTSLGFYRTAETYHGGHGLSLRMDGLSDSNSLARPRLIVIHGADYVSPHRNVLGRSWGCPAVERKHLEKIVEQLKGGALLFAYHANFSVY